MTDLDALEKLAREAAKALPGDWYADSVKSDGSYGSGDDTHEGYLAYTVFDEKDRAIVDTINSGTAEVHEEFDEDGHSAWDETGRVVTHFIAAANPQAILALISALRSRDAEVAGLRRALERQTEHIAAHAAARELLGMKARLTEAPRRPGSFACTSCNDTGMIAIRSRDGAYAFPGPVPDDARGYADADCWNCDCAPKPGWRELLR